MTGPSPPTRRARSRHWLDHIGIAAPLQHRDFRLLWTGLVVSLIGDGVFFVAVAWQAYNLSNSPSALAGVGLAASVPQVVLLLVGGAVSDRFAKRTVLLLADAARGGAMMVAAGLAWTGALQLWHLWGVALVIGGGTAFAAPAFDAFVPELVSERSLHQANGLDQFLRPAMLRLVGPALGGLLLALVGTANAFAVDAASFAASAWCVMLIHPPQPNAADPGALDGVGSLLDEMRAGIAYVRGQVWLWGTFVAATFTYLVFLGPTEVLVPYLVKNELHGSGATLGIVLGAGGVGALVAAAIVGQRPHIRRPITFMYAAWTAATLLVAGYGSSTANGSSRSSSPPSEPSRPPAPSCGAPSSNASSPVISSGGSRVSTGSCQPRSSRSRTCTPPSSSISSAPATPSSSRARSAPQ